MLPLLTPLLPLGDAASPELLGVGRRAGVLATGVAAGTGAALITGAGAARRSRAGPRAPRRWAARRPAG